jgi:hypothetical protein
MIDPEMSNRRGPLKTPEDWKPEPITLSSSSAKKRSGLKSGGGRSGKHGGGGGGRSSSRSSRRGAAKSEVAGQSEPACEMFESFRNLEDAMAMAKMQSLESSSSNYSNNAKATTTTEPQPDLIQSFRNLDMALAQAQHNSLGDVDEDAAYEDYDDNDDDDDDDCYNFNDHHDGNFNDNDNNGNGNTFFDTACGDDDDRRRKGTVIMESFRDLDEATALAIQNSLLLNERDKNLFRSCRNMDMPNNNAVDDDRMMMMMNNNTNNTNATARSAMEQGMFESFRNLDSAMSRAKHASLKPGGMEEHDENGNVIVVTGMDDTNNGTTSSDDYEHQQHLRRSNGNMSASDRTETSLFESFVNLDDAMAMAIKLSINDGMEDYDGFGEDELFDNDGGGGRTLGRLAEYEDDNNNNNDDATVRSGTDRMLDQKQRVHRATLDNANAVDSSSQSFNPRVEHVSRPAPNLSRLARRHADRRLAQDRAANNKNNKNNGGIGGSSALQHGSTESNNNNEGATTTTTTTITTTSATSGASNNNGTEGGSGTDRRSEGGSRIRRRRSRRSSSQGNVTLWSASDASLGGASDHSRGSSGGSADAFERRASLDRRASFGAMRRSGRSVAEGNGGGRDEDVGVGGNNRFRRSSTESTDATPPAPIIPNKEEQHDVKNLHYNRGRCSGLLEEQILGDNLNPVQRAKQKKKGKGRIGTLLGSLK